jgi:hypothetical protein
MSAIHLLGHKAKLKVENSAQTTFRFSPIRERERRKNIKKGRMGMKRNGEYRKRAREGKQVEKEKKKEKGRASVDIRKRGKGEKE